MTPPLTDLSFIQGSAPIVSRREDVQLLVDYINTIAAQNNQKTAAAEAVRLKDYFNRMSPVMLATADKEETKNHKGLFSPQGLAQVFNDVAAFTHNTVISDVAILPAGLLQTTPFYRMHFTKMNFDFSAKGWTFGFGFVQVMEKDPPHCKCPKRDAQGSSTTFSTLSLHPLMLNALRDAGEPQPLLKLLKSACMLVNHDMMHHFTISALNELMVAHRFNKTQFCSNTPLNDWISGNRERLYRSSNNVANPYEEWAHCAHDQILLSQPHDDLTKGACAMLDDYFAVLKDMAAAVPASYKTPREFDTPTGAEVQDYFSTVMGHMLARLFPLNHPVIQHWLDLDVAAAPAPGRPYIQGLHLLPVTSDKVLAIHNAYLQAGIDVFPVGCEKDYNRTCRLSALAEQSMHEVSSHVPSEKWHQSRGFYNDDTVKMIIATDKTSRLTRAPEYTGYH